MNYTPKKDQEYFEVLQEKISGMTPQERAQYVAGESVEDGLEDAISYESLRGQHIAVRDVQRFF